MSSLRLQGRSLLLRLLATLAFCIAAASARADDYPILGNWMIVRGIVAPWVPMQDEQRYQSDIDAHMKLIVVFAPDRMSSGVEVLNCADTDYGRTLYSASEIFQGNLPAPNQADIATTLGFPPGDIPGFDIDCSAGVFSFHFAARDRLMFALDNVIYTLDRQGE